MRIFPRAGLTVAALLAGGCLYTPADAWRAEVALGRAEVNLHHDKVIEAASWDQMNAEMDRHGAAMSEVMGGMRAALDGMFHCGGDGLGTMMDRLGDLEAAVAAHRDAVGVSGDLDIVRASCASHTTDIEVMFDEMAAAVRRMRCMSGHG